MPYTFKAATKAKDLQLCRLSWPGLHPISQSSFTNIAFAETLLCKKISSVTRVLHTQWDQTDPTTDGSTRLEENTQLYGGRHSAKSCGRGRTILSSSSDMITLSVPLLTKPTAMPSTDMHWPAEWSELCVLQWWSFIGDIWDELEPSLWSRTPSNPNTRLH